MKSLLCRKQLDQLLRDTEQTKHRLKRSLGALLGVADSDALHIDDPQLSVNSL